MIACDQHLADPITTFAQRPVLVGYELCHPWYVKYRAEMDARIRAYYSALLATDAAELIAFRDKYGVDYLIYESALFVPGGAKGRELYYEPLEKDFQAMFEHADFVRCVLPKIADDMTVFRHAGCAVLDLSDAKLRPALARAGYSVSGEAATATARAAER